MNLVSEGKGFCIIVEFLYPGVVELTREGESLGGLELAAKHK